MTQREQFKPVDVTAAQQMTQSDAIQYHYDNDTRFFSLWLDPTLSYSAARWTGPMGAPPHAEDLAAAQLEKIRYHLDAADVKQGTRLLDIGCGWGAVLKAAAERGADASIGLTLSRDQLDHIQAQSWPGVTALLEDVYDYRADKPFDAAISIGAFEHFAKPDMDRDQKVETYRTFFRQMAEQMTRGARFSLQTIVWGNVIDFADSKRLLPQTVFPQSDLPFIEEIAAGSSDTFRMVYMESDPDQYQRTLEAWIANLQHHRDTILKEWGAQKYDFFEHYLRRSRLSFKGRRTSLARFVLVRR